MADATAARPSYKEFFNAYGATCARQARMFSGDLEARIFSGDLEGHALSWPCPSIQ